MKHTYEIFFIWADIDNPKSQRPYDKDPITKHEQPSLNLLVSCPRGLKTLHSIAIALGCSTEEEGKFLLIVVPYTSQTFP